MIRSTVMPMLSVIFIKRNKKKTLDGSLNCYGVSSGSKLLLCVSLVPVVHNEESALVSEGDVCSHASTQTNHKQNKGNEIVYLKTQISKMGQSYTTNCHGNNNKEHASFFFKSANALN